MTIEDIKYIREALPFFDALEPVQQELLENSITLKKIAAGTVMHGGADDLDGLFLVKKGQARAFIVSDSV